MENRRILIKRGKSKDHVNINSIVKFKLLLIVSLLSVFISLNFVSAVFSFSNPQLAPNTATAFGFDNSLCQQGEDFIVQISPTGCTPVIVRSDLLEEQDVKVYCPLSATQINPLIDVKSISGISFSGNYSKYVRSIGFYPAQAALNLQGKQNTYPLLSNVGYVVIDLKQIQNESAMPDFVTGNLTAKINYDADKVFGAGNVNYYLKELSDSDWESDYPEYEFWNGKGYLRLDNIDNGKATIKIYDSNLNEQGTAVLEQGQASNAFSISGFDFCSGGAQIKLNALKPASMRVKLDVSGDLVEAAKGEKFLENNCQVADIQPQGLVRNVKITCSTDAGRKSFDLKIAPQIVLDINGENRTVNLGDYLYTVPGEFNVISNVHGGKSVFLGYIGSSSAEPNLDNLFVVLVALPRTAVQNQNQLTNAELSSIAGWMQRNTMDWKSGLNGILNVLRDAGKVVIGSFESAARLIVAGEAYAIIPYDASIGTDLVGSTSLHSADVKVTGFAEGQDIILGSQVKDYYNSATGDYSSILENYASETYPSDSDETLGEQALYEKIQLANQLQQKFTLPVLCDEFRTQYPLSKLDKQGICKDVSLLSSPTSSSQYISINGHAYVIGLRGVYSPTYEDYGAQITVRNKDGSVNTFQMIQNQIAVLNETTRDFMQLQSLTQTTAIVTGNVKVFTSNRATLTLGEPVAFGDYILTLDKINLKQFAQVSVIPKTSTIGSSADFSFNIGIEKRLIQLSPEKTEEKLKALNEGILKWEQITNTTGKILQGLETACEVSGVVLTAKNFVENLISGTGDARQTIMRGIWNSRCADLVSQGNYISQEQCFLRNSNAINNDVTELAEFKKQQNEIIKNLEKPFTTSSVLGGTVVDTDKFMKRYSTNVQTSLGKLDSIPNPNNPSQTISIAEAKQLMNYPNWKNNNFNIADARDIELYVTVLSSTTASQTLKDLSKQKLYLALTDIKVNSQQEILQETLGEETGLGEGNVMIGSFQKMNEVSITQPKTFGSTKYYAMNAILGISALDYAFGFKDSSNGINYLITYSQDGVVTGTYSIASDGFLGEYKNAQGNSVKNPFNFFFKQYSEGSYKNTYKNPKVHYFETQPYKGMPAIVPIDLDEGWYAGLKQTLGVGNNIRTYDASDRINSFYLCNVGENGIQEFNSGIGDDTCQSMDLGSGSTYNTFPGLEDSSKVTALVRKAVSAIQGAARAYQSGVSRVVIDGRSLQVGAPAADVPNIQCQDFMSPADCNLLFNVCDPVICPSSRCDFGGAYPVKDVQQTGIVGSALLCLPNIKEGIAVPVCLSGIQAGTENLISVQKAYAQCLQEKLDTGKTVGVCDEIHSIYLCSFFWEQAAPLANLAVPKITEFLLGQTSRGGGEYLSVQGAFENARQSTNYLTNYYAGSQQAFQLSKLNIGSVFCQNFASLTIPSGAEIMEQISTPDSPPQFTGTFEEITLTTATIPPTSQYKVFYHIYAGKNEGVYYSVYLQRTAGSSFYQDSSSILAIDSGYISAGGFADETVDKSASSGYDQLCINVNGQVECGFQQVSTSLAVNYLQDQYLATEVSRTDITTESACRSGSPNIYSLLNPNVQNAVGDVINPELYNQGITRTCATDNPGIGTDAYAGTENSRWVEVGYCGDKNLKCWLDTKGIKDILDSPDLAAYITNGTTTSLGKTNLDSVGNNYLSILTGTGYLSDEIFSSKIHDINSKGDSNEKLSLISEIIDKVFYNNQKAYLLLLRGGAYGKLATALNDEESLESLEESAAAGLEAEASVPDAGRELPAPTAPGEAAGEGAIEVGDEDVQEFRECLDELEGTAGAVGQCSVKAGTGKIAGEDNILKAMNYAKTNIIVNKKCNCGSNCRQYAISLVEAGEKYGVDPLLLLSVMIQESECNQWAASVTGSGTIQAVGLMQIYSWEDCLSLEGVNGQGDLIGENYEENIECGALILKNKYNEFGSRQNAYTCSDFSKTYTGWDAALRGYVGYGCTNVGYVEEVNAIYNALKIYLTGAEEIPEYDAETYAVTISEEESSSDFISPTIEYRDGRPFWGNLYYKFFNQQWYWSRDQIKWEETKSLPTQGDENREFITNLRSAGTYSEGLDLLFKRIASEGASRAIKPSLSTGSADMSYLREFTYRYKKEITPKTVYLRYSNDQWEWRAQGEDTWFVGVKLGGGYYGEPVSLLEYLNGKNFFDGARAILGDKYPLYSGQQTAEELCGYCVNAFSPDGAYCSKIECENRLGDEVIERFPTRRCRFTPLEGDTGKLLGGNCIDVPEQDFVQPKEEPIVIDRPTAEDKENAQGVCEYCSNRFSLEGAGCSREECETRLGQEAYNRFLMKCRFTALSGRIGSCNAVTEEDYAPYGGKTYRIDRIGFNISGQTVYDQDVVRRGAVELVVDSGDNCQWMSYEIWKEGVASIGDLKVATDNNLQVINTVLSETTTKGKYHVDVLCFDPDGKYTKITSKNLEVDASSLVAEETSNVDRIGFKIAGRQTIFNQDVVRTGVVELVVESANNCVPARYEIWKEGAVFGLGDLKVATDNNLQVINTVLSNTTTKGKYHVDVYCIDNTGKSNKIVSKNLEIK